MKKRIGQFLFQLLPVALGVYLGIVASNWNERSKMKTLKQETIDRLIVEYKSNTEQLKYAAAYHIEVSQNIDSLIRNLPAEALATPFFKNGGFSIVQGWQGVNMPSLDYSVYQTALMNGTLNELKFETLRRINQINNTEAEQFRDSTYASYVVDLGGQIVRNNLSSILKAENTMTHLKGVYLANGSQHIDNQTFMKIYFF